ncbi:MAG: sigma-70 family RNA polymerase sigma factor [Bryobacterales bacterium]|nr:sigma-70 family RNA polymerase sigma factor [Bryobacterales bacterium]
MLVTFDGTAARLSAESGADAAQASSNNNSNSSPEPHSDDFHATSPPQLQSLVDRLKHGEPGAMEDLYRIFSRGVRFYLCRQLGPQELEDKVHDTFLIVVQAIQRGDLREPERLMGFIRTVVRRQVAAHIETAVQARREQLDIAETGTFLAAGGDPEEDAIVQQKAELMELVLRGLSPRDREILTRFYLDEQSQEQICQEMQLTETQFRLLKSRAKTRFGELGKKKLTRRPISTFSLRSFLTA